ncbi:hypothetical protein HNY73_008480 [Argiope bruennichi]|uniref:Uncharacterized protein n=1 Tax=Argiope bruennichi TaxID=94029 RepID=A0A8T0F919_ARGBR|nr:hypothetical protein HNY73_008480 [Argiope bruennichi]
MKVIAIGTRFPVGFEFRWRRRSIVSLYNKSLEDHVHQAINHTSCYNLQSDHDFKLDSCFDGVEEPS